MRFVIRAAGAATLDAPDTAYAGYPFVVKATYAGTGGQVQLQRKAGSSWKTIARFTGDAEPIITLAKRGRQTLRTVVQVGSDTVTSKTQTVDVKRARNWSTSRRDDGTYRDPERASVRLEVTGNGKRIAGFQAGRKLRETRASIAQTSCSGSIAVEARRTGR